MLMTAAVADRAAAQSARLVIKDGMPPISKADEALLGTRTLQPGPSPQLVAALDLGAADWDRPDAAQRKVRIGDAAARQSAEAALAALRALPPAAAQNDYDRAWIAFETADSLRELGRRDEAIAQFETLLTMPRTIFQDRRTLAALHELGDARRPGSCGKGAFASDVALLYPPAAGRRGIEGWVQPLVDVAADGRIEYVAIVSSSARAFEAPVREWLATARWRDDTGAAPGAPCHTLMRARFTMPSRRDVAFSIDAVPADETFTFRSIGAARMIRGAARDAVLRSEPAGSATP